MRLCKTLHNLGVKMSKLFVLIAVSLWSSVAADSYLASVQPTHILKETETCEFVCRDQGQDCVWMGLEEEVCQLLLQSLTEPREPHQQEAYFILNVINNTAGVVYTCVQGYTGETCDTDVDECLSSLCQNSATCVDGANGYTCSCMSGYVGTHCETAVINKSDCYWSLGLLGEFLTCQPGYVHIGACGSGSQSDCTGYVNEIRCCRTIAAPWAPSGMSTVTGGHGEEVYCPHNMIVYATCGSKAGLDCYNTLTASSFSVVLTCQASTLALGSCQWYWGNYGDFIFCPQLTVVAGRCGSGSASNCNTSYGHGVYCCNVN